MGRKPTSPNAVPRLRIRKRKRHTWFFYDHGIVAGKRKLEPLGSDYAKAVQKWAELEGLRKGAIPAVVMFRDVANEYRRLVITEKAPRTRRDNGYELANLLAFFDDPPAPLDVIEAQHVAQYMRWRSSAPIRPAVSACARFRFHPIISP